MRAVDVLAKVYQLHAEQRTDDAIDLIFTTVDADLKGTRGRMANDLLVQADIERLDENLIVGILTATYPARSMLAYRQQFSQRALERLRLHLGDAVATNLLEELT